MYIFVFGVVGTLITFSVVAPLTYLANQNDMFYFTFYDKQIQNTNHNINETIIDQYLPLLPTQNSNLSSHIALTPNNPAKFILKNEQDHVLEIVNSTIEENLFNKENENKKITEEKTEIKNDIITETTENLNKDSILKFSVKDILLFSAVISATDTVAALTFIKEDKDPKLFAILFGEGVLNDAVCIVLYKIIKEFTESNEGK